MKKKILVLLAALTLIISVVGCTPNQNPVGTVDSNSAAQENETIGKNYDESAQKDSLVDSQEKATESKEQTSNKKTEQSENNDKKSDNSKEEAVSSTKNESVQSKEDANLNPETEKTSSDDKKYIGKSKAKEIALKHANVKSSGIFDYEIELDNEGKTSVYEISFNCGDFEYQYDINAVDGTIIKSEKEHDD